MGDAVFLNIIIYVINPANSSVVKFCKVPFIFSSHAMVALQLQKRDQITAITDNSSAQKKK